MLITGMRWLIAIILLMASTAQAYDTASRAGRETTSLKTWGPYRPNLYFGVRPTIPDTLLFGLMWASGDDQSGMLNTLRDTCEQSDGMEGYGWTAYDVRIGGSQTMHDSTLQLDLKTDFFKTKDGESWTVRVTGTPRSGAPTDLKTALIFHVAVENAENATEQRAVRCDHNPKGPGVACMGRVPELGDIDFFHVWDSSSKLALSPAIKSLTVSEDRIWQAKAVYVDTVKASHGDSMLVDEPDVGNVHFSQVVFEGEFSAYFIFRSNAAAFLPPELISSAADTYSNQFSVQVDKAFTRKAPFEETKYANLSQTLTANLLAGMGVFHGDQRVDNSHAMEYEETDPNFWDGAANAMSRAEVSMTTSNTSLISFVPSRPFFPRGFLWDEGFHLLAVVEWDFDLAILVLKSWLSLMDEDGWIAREQILGPEARIKVPKEFQIQYPHLANPPTFLSLLLPIIISKITRESSYEGHKSKYITHTEQSRALIEELFPLFERHYNWFRRTQAGNFTAAYARPSGANAEGYRWRGRTPGHCLTSGLDDYPRAEPPHPGELHVDALAWVGASAEALRRAAEYLGRDSIAYAEQVKSIRHNLDALHWDAKNSAYCDVSTGNRKDFQHVCHLGYVSLMPLLTGHMNETHPNLPAVLDLISDPRKLWSPNGLRSLSLTDENYGKNEDYWRGPVWMNLNVLAVLRLKDLGNSTASGVRAQSLAARLRKNVIKTVYDSWEKTGFAWEQYNDKTGEGQGSRAFTGWTATILLLMGLEDGAMVNDGTVVHSSGVVAWLVLVISIVAIFLGLWVFRRRVTELYSRAMSALHSSKGKYRHLGEESAPEEVMSLDDIYESDTDEDGR
ncbi:hypothetical protein AB5N19_08407 [Seiridium cardinale]